MSADLLTDGFLLLQRMPIEEIEERINWLEGALTSYKTLLMVRQAMETKPGGLLLPKSWKPIVEKDKKK